MSEILQKWSALKKSEQTMLIYGGLSVLISGLYFYIWVPYQQTIHALEQQISHSQGDLVWLNAQARQIKLLKSSAAPSVGSYSGSLMNVMLQSIKQYKLNKQVSLLEKSGTDKVVLQFNQIAFDDLIKLLGYLKKRYGIVVKNIDIQKTDNGKWVNSRVILQ
ncbi:MAG: type II secretion system protein M [gamma proteobacterium symbiont of Bathyaustriella thionipta]|nr:type II secretion system protein M [gamma proteobacterium symbiont of Bathyaustriella thionipta]MCU7951666.1 type II secretion system protein M [gamma proteobacterium symbiont of Bathyaustriella thionipta]MCU7952275.1 type II secretion system protein M [gamma proteobacterium symbiont of Bathyaustriella thionipta]